MIGCDDARRLILRDLDGKSDRASAMLLRAHLDACSACRAAADTQRVVRQVLSSRPAEPLPADFHEDLCARLDAERAGAGTRDWRAWTLRLAPFAAAAAILALLVPHRTHAQDLAAALAALGASEATAPFAEASAGDDLAMLQLLAHFRQREGER